MRYNDTATFVKTASTGYSGARTITGQSDIPCIFIQNTGLQKEAYVENKKTDALCYPDPFNPFIQARLDSLEGMYIIFDEQWYKIASYSINRTHLLENVIDNIEMKLERVNPIAQVS